MRYITTCYGSSNIRVFLYFYKYCRKVFSCKWRRYWCQTSRGRMLVGEGWGSLVYITFHTGADFLTIQRVCLKYVMVINTCNFKQVTEGLSCIKIYFFTLAEIKVLKIRSWHYFSCILDKKLERYAKNWIFQQSIILLCKFSMPVHDYPTTRCVK